MKKKIYVIIGKNAKGKWQIESCIAGVGSIIIPKTRFTRKEAEEYCAYRNKFENKKTFDFRGIKVI